MSRSARAGQRGQVAADEPARRVLIVTGEYPPMVGGLADHTRCLKQAIEAEGWTVAVLTSIEASPGTRISAIVRRWDWSVFSRVRRAIRSHRPAVVHLQYQTAAYGLHPAICLVPYVLLTRGGPPVVVQMHDLRLPYLLPKAGPLRRIVTRTLLRWSRGVILSNQADFEWIDRWLAAAEADGLTPAGRPPAYLIPIGANVEENPPPGYDRSAFRASLGLSADAFVVVFFGLANQGKGLPELIEAVAALRAAGVPVRLLIVGGDTAASDPTNRATRAELDREIDARDLRAVVRLTGTLTPPAVSAHLLAADVVALPYRDGASFRRGSLLAAIAHGLPIVTTAGPNPADRRVPGAELIDGVNCRLVPPGPAALADALLALARAPEERERLAAGARRLAPTFAWPAIARQTIAAYERAISGSAPPSRS